VHLSYNDQPVNTGMVNSRCLMWVSCVTYKFTVFLKSEFVRIVAVGTYIYYGQLQTSESSVFVYTVRSLLNTQ